MRKLSIKCRYSYKIERICKWLKLDCDFAGSFVGPTYTGYKTMEGDKLTFHFERKNKNANSNVGKRF